jgi:flagellar biosynthesis protein FlhG
MADFQRDQAEGLRRLLERARVRMMTLDSGCPGVGKTSAVINVAAALAARGSRVLVIDENSGPANVGGLLGVRPRFELQHVIRGACALEDALLTGPRGVTILCAADGARALPGLRRVDQERLLAGFGGLDGRFDVVLVDTPCAQADRTGLFTHAVQDTIIVSSLAADAITASYSLIKRLREGPSGRRFYLLLNRVGCERNARVVSDNLRTVAQGYLATPLECLGCVPNDRSLRQAGPAFRPVVEAYPATPAAAGYRRIATAIADWPHERAQPHSLNSLMQRLLSPRRFTFANAGV